MVVIEIAVVQVQACVCRFSCVFSGCSGIILQFQNMCSITVNFNLGVDASVCVHAFFSVVTLQLIGDLSLVYSAFRQ